MEWIDGEMQIETEMIVSWLMKVLFMFPIHIRIDQNQNTGIWRPSNWIWKSLEGSDPKLEEEHVFHLIMNNSVCVKFLGDMRPYNNFNSHIWPSPEIWFETGHFEFLSFWASGSVSGMFTNWDWNNSRGKIKWNLKNW